MPIHIKGSGGGTQEAPTISVNSDTGLITATAGTKSATHQMIAQAAKTVIPWTVEQTAVSAGRYTTGAVKVAGDANLRAANIVRGVSIFGVTGTAETGGFKSEEVSYYVNDIGKIELGVHGATEIAGLFICADANGSYAGEVNSLVYVAHPLSASGFGSFVAGVASMNATTSSGILDLQLVSLPNIEIGASSVTVGIPDDYYINYYFSQRATYTCVVLYR